MLAGQVVSGAGSDSGCIVGSQSCHLFSDDGFYVDWETDEGPSFVRKFQDCVKI